MKALINFFVLVKLSSARSCIRFGDYAKAISLAGRQSQRFPKNPSVRLLLADACLFGGELNTAITHYKKAQDCLEEKGAVDRRYLGVYLNHRLFEADFLLGKHDLIVTEEIIEEINRLALKRHTRALFRLAPKEMVVPRPFANRSEL